MRFEKVGFWDKLDKWESLKTEIERTDKKIDGEVYKIYGLNGEEIKVVENS